MICMLVLVSIIAVANDRHLREIKVTGPGFSRAELKNLPFNPQDGKAWQSLKKGEIASYEVQDDRIALRAIEFSLSKDAYQPSVSVYALLTLPEFMPEVKPAYQYVEVDYSNFKAEDVEGIYHYFYVEKSFLEEEGFEEEDVVIATLDYDYAGSEWIPQKTRLVEENEDFLLFKVYSEAARYFAITAAKAEKEEIPLITGSAIGNVGNAEEAPLIEDAEPLLRTFSNVLRMPVELKKQRIVFNIVAALALVGVFMVIFKPGLLYKSQNVQKDNILKGNIQKENRLKENRQKGKEIQKSQETQQIKEVAQAKEAIEEAEKPLNPEKS